MAAAGSGRAAERGRQRVSALLSEHYEHNDQEWGSSAAASLASQLAAQRCAREDREPHLGQVENARTHPQMGPVR
jgi:hypothetical protein